MSNAGWWKRTKAALALMDWLDRLLLFSPAAMHGPSVAGLIEAIPSEEIRAEGRALLAAYRRAAVAAPPDQERRHKRADRRARTDAGREQDARDAGAGNLVR